MAASPEPVPKRRKLLGRKFYESIGSPRTVVAPMVEQSELAWRLLSRRLSAENTLCYTPMFHSHLFHKDAKYRGHSFQGPHLDGNAGTDRPVFVQFCSNLPEDLSRAAKLVQEHCDAVDLNLGCPQGIAKRGNYGAFLQEDWGLIAALISTLRDALDVPVTAKIRILETKERSLEYARMVVDAGATILTVHGRRREQKGHNTGLADWSYIRYIRENLPPEIVVFANGNILWQEDIPRCLAATGADAVMSAEGNLYNPAIFTASEAGEDKFPRVDKVAREYLDIIRTEILPKTGLLELLKKPQSGKSKKKINLCLKDASLTAIKAHLFKLWHALLAKHTDIRIQLSKATCRHDALEQEGDVLKLYYDCLARVEEVIEDELNKNPEVLGDDGKWIGPDQELMDAEDSRQGIIVEVGNPPRKVRRNVPWYRCQPYFRPLPEEAMAAGALKPKEHRANLGSARKAVYDEEPEPKRIKTADGRELDLEAAAEEVDGDAKNHKATG